MWPHLTSPFPISREFVRPCSLNGGRGTSTCTGACHMADGNEGSSQQFTCHCSNPTSSLQSVLQSVLQSPTLGLTARIPIPVGPGPTWLLPHLPMADIQRLKLFLAAPQHASPALGSLSCSPHLLSTLFRHSRRARQAEKRRRTKRLCVRLTRK